MGVIPTKLTAGRTYVHLYLNSCYSRRAAHECASYKSGPPSKGKLCLWPIEPMSSQWGHTPQCVCVCVLCKYLLVQIGVFRRLSSFNWKYHCISLGSSPFKWLWPHVFHIWRPIKCTCRVKFILSSTEMFWDLLVFKIICLGVILYRKRNMCFTNEKGVSCGKNFWMVIQVNKWLWSIQRKLMFS